jgi:23S rRNA (guanosine2251-2'-O)-methyltransferase
MDRGKKTYLFGVNPVLEKLKVSPQEILEIAVVGESQRASIRSIEEAAKGRCIPVRYLETQVLNRLAEGGKHQGVVAQVRSYSYQVFADLLRDCSSSSAPACVLFLDGVTDPRNFGALLRTAEAAGVRHVVIPKDRSVGVTPSVFKTSTGAVHHMKIFQVPNLRGAMQDLKEKGFWIVGLDSKAKESLFERSYPEKVGVVLGAEGGGIRPLIRQECDFVVSIPMRGKISSLNVAVAGGVFFYELLRQRNQL